MYNRYIIIFQDPSALHDTCGTEQINNGFNEMRVRYYFIRKEGVF